MTIKKEEINSCRLLWTIGKKQHKFNKVVSEEESFRKKKNDGRTTWIVQRNDNTIVLWKRTKLKIVRINFTKAIPLLLNEWTFQKIKKKMIIYWMVDYMEQTFLENIFFIEPTIFNKFLKNDSFYYYMNEWMNNFIERLFGEKTNKINAKWSITLRKN